MWKFQGLLFVLKQLCIRYYINGKEVYRNLLKNTKLQTEKWKGYWATDFDSLFVIIN